MIVSAIFEVVVQYHTTAHLNIGRKSKPGLVDLRLRIGSIVMTAVEVVLLSRVPSAAGEMEARLVHHSHETA